MKVITQADFFSDLDRLRITSEPPSPPEELTSKIEIVPTKLPRIQGEFLKGPIPLSWLSAAAALPGKAPLSVGLAIWFEAGRRRALQVKLTTAIVQRFGLNRKAKYRGLLGLEKAGLVEVHRQPRRNPLVTILTSIVEQSSTPDTVPVGTPLAVTT